MALGVGWTELLAHPEVTEVTVLGSRFGVMAFHGGLEAGTAEIAKETASLAGASLYCVEQPAGLRWHVPSTEVDPASSQLLARFLSHVDNLVAIHGYGRPHRPAEILVGGANRRLARKVAGALRAHLGGTGGLEVIDDLEAIPGRLRGVHPRNPVNGVPGGGVQLELPVEVRRTRRDPVVAALADVARDSAEPSAGDERRQPGGVRTR